jgi:hypothetical protein
MLHKLQHSEDFHRRNLQVKDAPFVFKVYYENERKLPQEVSSVAEVKDCKKKGDVHSYALQNLSTYYNKKNKATVLKIPIECEDRNFQKCSRSI